MCGILGFIGQRNGVPIVHAGLQSLSYRGYDSWGLAAQTNHGTLVHKQIGDVSSSVPLAQESRLVIGHTRWATHGGVTQENAHPHQSSCGMITVVHNGIIENYAELRGKLISQGYTFTSETDTEVVAHLIHSFMEWGESFTDAFQHVLACLEGSYALIATHADEHTIQFARHGSPLVLGLGTQELFISSDIPSFLPHTKTLMYLEDGDYGYLDDAVHIYHDGKPIDRQPTTAPWSVDVAKKGEYDHFMIKEINEQPLTIRKALNQPHHLLSQTAELVQTASTVFLVGCGTSYNACAASAYQFAKSGKYAIPVLGSEFHLHASFLDANSVVVAVSQSGETADVLDAVNEAKTHNARVIAIVNVPSSTLARLADVVIPMNSGPELSVVSTKCFTAQLSLLTSLALALSGKRNDALKEAADLAMHVIKQHDHDMRALAKRLCDARSLFVIGRESLSPLAREAALKIKEVSYIHAEGMPAGELKHGTIAVVEEGTPVIVFADTTTRQLATSNAMEVKARGAFVIGIDSTNSPSYDVHITIPEIDNAAGILSIIPIQLLSYYLALERDCNPDKPRNLAKSVTVR